MTAQAYELLKKRNLTPLAIFTIGLVLLLTSWVIVYWWTALFTEALLVPWYCCGQDSIPAIGTWQRTINDFFNEFPGSALPSLTFVTISIAIFISRLSKAKNRVWLPAIFFLAFVILLAADLAVTNLSWAISSWIVGPWRGALDVGYHRTWYGIVSHLALWCIFFAILAKVKITRINTAFQK